MSKFVFIYRVLFSLHFISYGCKGQVYPPSNQSITFLPGSTARLKWTVVGDPAIASLAWFFTRRGGSKEEEIAAKYRNNGATINNSSLPGVAVETPATLVLKNVDQRYNGKYRLNVQVVGGGGEAEVDVFIAVTPTVTLSCSSPITLYEGDDFTCVCRGEGGNPPASVTWYKDGEQIGGTGKEEQTMTLSNVDGKDSGTYKCMAQSHINATNETSIEIIVKLNSANTAANKEDDGTTVAVWHIVVSLVSGFILGILFSYIVWCSRRRWFRNRNPEPKTTEVDTTYQELDLSKMNKEDNYQSLRVNAARNDAAANDDDSTYTQLSKTRDVEDNYQSLT